MSKSTAYRRTDLMREIISLLEKRWIGPDQIHLLADRTPIQNTQQKIWFYRELKRLIRLIPEEVFDDDEHRQNLINATQMALEAAIEQEEDELDGMD